jgi:hypothetical protein
MSLAKDIILPSQTCLKKVSTKNGKAWTTTLFDNDGKIYIPPFKEIPTSTMTVIAHTNLFININKFFKYIPITDFTVVKKKRGRKRKITTEDPNRFVPPGSVISLTKQRLVRGVILKTKKKESKTYFRHSVSTVMVLSPGKFINVKVSSSGKFQMTGCKSINHAIEFVKHIYSHMIETEEWTGETLFAYKSDYDNETPYDDDKDEVDENENLERNHNDGLGVVFQIAMRNIDFATGYRIRRDKLDNFINRFTEFRSIFESSIGNSSVNIKLPATNSVDNSLRRLRITSSGEVIEDTLNYETFYNLLGEKDRKQLDKNLADANHTFLAFASGKVIFSSRGDESQNVFYKFIKILIEQRQHIEEIIEMLNVDTNWMDE